MNVALTLIGVSKINVTIAIVSVLTMSMQAISFIVGYALQDIKLALYIALGGTALIFVVVVPPWPFFKRHPVKWLPVGAGAQIQAPEHLVIDQKAVR